MSPSSLRPRPGPQAGLRYAHALALACLLGFALVVYGPALDLPFLGDDYVFLDKTRFARFTELWSFANTNFGWYRPWSRELHFWVLQRLVGAHELAFRTVSVMLWLWGLLAYMSLVREFASRRTRSEERRVGKECRL